MSVDAGLRGVQQPRISLVPDYVSSAGPQLIELAALAGLELDPWERLVVTHATGERADGKWAAFEAGINVPRQNGKGSILETRELGGLFVLNERLLVHSAHEQATSSEHFRRLLDLIEGVPEFERRVLKAPRGKGSEAIELRGGQRILFKTRTGGGGRGLTGDFVALDEAMILPVAMTAALVPTMAARSITGNPQLWYAGSAVDQEKHDHGIVFTRLRQRALAGAGSLAYFEWSADVQGWLERHGLRFDPLRPEIDQVTQEMLDDVGEWARGNPGLGIRIALEHIARERGGALASREFAVERLGVTDPPDTSEDSGRVISTSIWEACAEHDQANRIVSVPVFAVDVNPDQTWASVAVAGKRGDGLPQGAVVQHERGTDWIVAFCKRLKESHRGCKFVVHVRSTGSALIEAMKLAHLRLVEASTEDYGRACMEFVPAVTDCRFRWPDTPANVALTEALANARKDPLGDAWKWSRKNSASADISPLCAVTLAVWGAERAKRARAINPNDFL